MMNTMVPISTVQKHSLSQFSKTVISQKQIQQKVLDQSQNQVHLLQNYLGNHNNLKLQFKNKRYKKIYNFLSKNAPLQSMYIPLYLQDKLFALIKIIKTSFIHKETSLFEYLQPYFQKAKECIVALYQFNLTDKKIIKNTKKVNMELASRANQFFYIVINFVHHLSTFYRSKAMKTKSRSYYQINYAICSKLLQSSTSSCRIRRKISQILISYTAFLIQIKETQLAQQILLIALKNTINLLGILQMRLKYEAKQKQINRKMLQCFRFMCSIYLNLAVCFQMKKKEHLVYASLLQVKLLEEIIQKRYGFKNKVSQFIKKPKETFDQYCEISTIVSSYFNYQTIKNYSSQIQIIQASQKDASNNINQNINTSINGQKAQIARYQTFHKKKKTTQHKLMSKNSIISVHSRGNSNSIQIDQNQRDLNILLYGAEYLQKPKSSYNPNINNNNNTNLNAQIKQKFSKENNYNYNHNHDFNHNHNYEQSSKSNKLTKKKKQINYWNTNFSKFKKEKILQEDKPKVTPGMIEKTKQQFLFDDQLQKCKIFRLKCKNQVNTKKLEDSKQNVYKFPVKTDKFDNFIDKKYSSLCKNQKKQKSNWGQTGIRLFKKIIFKHKKQLGMTKMDLFINTNQQETAQIKLIERQSLLMVQYDMNSQEIKMRIQQNMKDLISDNIRNSNQNQKKVKKINKAISQYQKNKHMQQFNSRIQQSYGRNKGKSLRFNLINSNSSSILKPSKHTRKEQDLKSAQNQDSILKKHFDFGQSQSTNPKLFLTSFCTSPKPQKS